MLKVTIDHFRREKRPMTEKRRFHRITYVVGGTLLFGDTALRCRLENLSLAGALVTIRDADTFNLRKGDTCQLRLYHEVEGHFITVEARIVHHVFAIVGLSFLSLGVETKTSLGSIMEREKRKARDVDYNVMRYSPYRNAERLSP
jgi:c-di-GMP-binding flagellar brake protein YcgR